MARRALVYLGEQQLMRILKLPEGFRVIGVNADFYRVGVVVMVESDALPDIIEGGTIPNLTNEQGQWESPVFKTWADGYEEGFNDGVVSAIEERADG